MPLSGIPVDPSCITVFEELKRSKKSKYIIYKIGTAEDGEFAGKIFPVKESAEQDYDTFVQEFDESEPRYAVYDFSYSMGEGVRNKICFFAWNPDTASIKKKMTYTTSKDALKLSLSGIATEVQATSPEEVDYDAVLEKVSKGRA